MSWVNEVFALLSRGGPRPISLDEIGEAIGVRFAEPESIDRLLSLLEQAGFAVEVPGGLDLGQRLVLVLSTARALRREGAVAGLGEIAAKLGWTVRETRTVLLYGEVLSRGSRAPG